MDIARPLPGVLVALLYRQIDIGDTYCTKVPDIDFVARVEPSAFRITAFLLFYQFNRVVYTVFAAVVTLQDYAVFQPM